MHHGIGLRESIFRLHARFIVDITLHLLEVLAPQRLIARVVQLVAILQAGGLLAQIGAFRLLILWHVAMKVLINLLHHHLLGGAGTRPDLRRRNRLVGINLSGE